MCHDLIPSDVFSSSLAIIALLPHKESIMNPLGYIHWDHDIITMTGCDKRKGDVIMRLRNGTMAIMESRDDPWNDDELERMIRDADSDFNPPISQRSGYRHDFANDVIPDDGINAYMESLRNNTGLTLLTVRTMDGEPVAKTLVEREDDRIYIALMLTGAQWRGLGAMGLMYGELESLSHDDGIPLSLRISSDNDTQRHILNGRGWVLDHAIMNHRGDGIHTIYYTYNGNGDH